MIMTSKYYLDTVEFKYQNYLFSLSVLGLCYSRICKLCDLYREKYIFLIYVEYPLFVTAAFYLQAVFLYP